MNNSASSQENNVEEQKIEPNAFDCGSFGGKKFKQKTKKVRKSHSRSKSPSKPTALKKQFQSIIPKEKSGEKIYRNKGRHSSQFERQSFDNDIDEDEEDYDEERDREES